MTTIKLKNGSGAPTAGDLVQGEPALDLTNKRLYTEDSGGTVIEVGTNPGTDVTFADNRKAIFGAGSDLQIYHDGSNSYIDDTATGHLFIRSNGDGIYLRSNTNEEIAHFNVNGSVKAYYDNSLKLATTSTGIDVTGQVKATSDFIAADSGGVARGYLFGTSGGLFARFNSGGTFQVQESGSTKLTVNSTGINVTGTVTSTSFGSQLATTLFEQNVLKSSVTASSGAFVRMAVSSSSNPTYAFEDDTDTGVFTSGANTLNFGTAGTERLRIDSGGDISFYEDTGTTAKFSWSSSNETIAIGTGASSTATISAFSRTVSANLPSALRIIENTGASSYWDIGANNGSSPNLNFYVNANTTPKVTFASSGNVGIGTSSPSSALHVDSSNDGPIFDSGGTGNTNHALLVRDSANSQLLRVNNNGNVGIGTTAPREKIHLHGGTSSTQLLMTGGGLNSEIYGGFIEGDGVSGQGGHLRLGVLDAGTERVGIEIEEQGNQITFDTAGTERMRIDSSGNLLVGKTDTTFNTAGIALRSTDVLQVTRSGDTALELNRTSNDGKLAEFYRSGVSVGSIGVQVGGLEIDGNPSATTTLRFGTSSTIYPATDNAGDIGASGNRFKDLYLSSGIHANNAFQRWKAVDNNGGSGIFSTITNGEPQTGFLYAYETGTEKYIIAALFKEDESSVVTTTQIANNGLTVNATNAGGTIALAGATTASNVRMQAVTIKRS